MPLPVFPATLLEPALLPGLIELPPEPLLPLPFPLLSFELPPGSDEPSEFEHAAITVAANNASVDLLRRMSMAST